MKIVRTTEKGADLAQIISFINDCTTGVSMNGIFSFARGARMKPSAVQEVLDILKYGELVEVLTVTKITKSCDRR